MKQETLEEAAKNYSENWEEITGLDWDKITPIDVSKLDFMGGAKWQEQRMYSEEEVKPLIDFIIDCSSNWDCDEDAHRYGTPCRMCDAQKLLKEFKKK